MHTEILSKYSLWFILPLLLFSAFLAWYLYRKDEKITGLDGWQICLMATARFLSIFFIGFLLLSIAIRYVSIKIEEPLIIVAQDNSESVKLANNGQTINYKTKFSNFLKGLGSDYSVETLSFGEKVSDSISYSFNEKESNFTALFEHLEKEYVNYNIGALVIASDGIYNKGINPVYSAKKLSYPIYTIALGDSSRKKDTYIKDLLNNPIAFLGDKFPLEIHLSSFGFSGKSVNLSVLNNGKTIINEKIDIKSNDFFKKLHFDIEAEKKGLQHYHVKISALDGEFTTSNNYKSFAIDVIDDKKKVLVLANSVHPDISAIREALKTNKNILTDFYTVDSFDKNIEDYQLIIFHQLPSFKHGVKNLFLRLNRAKIPALFILGSKTNIAILNTLNTGFKLMKNQRAFELSVAYINNKFNLFEIEQIKAAKFSNYPPLVAPFGEYKMAGKADILMYQDIKGIKTEKPLIFLFAENDNTLGKYGFICGEGIWKWRINDYRENESHTNFDGLINKLVHYLSLNIKKERFVVHAKRIFNENEPIIFRADYYNKSYELNNEAEVSLEITNEENKKFSYLFSPYNSSYTLNIGQLPVGNYSYTAKTRAEGKTFVNSGSFIIVPLNVEAVNIQANFPMLFQLAHENGGAMFLPDSLDRLISNLKLDKNIKAISFSTKDITDLIELKWLFFIIIGLLSLEWFLRKFFGSY